jgi:alkanesulfonate monooxygenase SsuD/methylene tetrahydromethanopterin reductase-like flavin-dependent oxidoreductase (luciferase family)
VAARRVDDRSAAWEHGVVELGVHLPLIPLGDEPVSLARLGRTADHARELGYAALAANDHFVYGTPWLDGPTALAAVIERSGALALATTVSLAVLRGPVALAKTLAAIDLLSGGRLVAALGPGSSARDYEALGVPFGERWTRLEEAVIALRALLEGAPPPDGSLHYPLPAGIALAPVPERAIPLWIGSWGSPAGLRRVARIGDGWLASAYNTTPDGFATARTSLARSLEARGRDADGFPSALSTMWTWVARDRAERDRVLSDVLAPMLSRDAGELAGQLCVGSAEHCAELLSRYAAAGCGRVYLWPLGDEARQLELVARTVAPLVVATS